MINQYTEPEDFLMDDTFKQFCEGSNQSCVVFWENWITTNPEKHELVEKAQKLFRLISGNLKPVNQQIDYLNVEISREIKKQEFPFLRYGIAASLFIFLLAGLFRFYYQSSTQPAHYNNTFFAARGEKRKITLADGTLVYLNSDSKIEVDGYFNKKERNVRLTGEAFFDVKHDKDKPFKVLTNNFKITVLGTAFNVKSYPNDKKAEATLVRGVIKFEDNNLKGSSIIIKRGQKIIYNSPPAITKTHTGVQSDTTQHLPTLEIVNLTTIDHQVAESAWINNDLIFYDKTFLEIKPVLERWFNTTLLFKDKEVENYIYNANFKNEDLNTILNKLQQVKHFSFKKEGGLMVITK